MPSPASIAEIPRAALAHLRATLSALLLLLPVVAPAEAVLYQATVPLTGLTEADRAAGFGEALRVAAVRASGRRDAASNPVIASAAASPQRYVQQYSTTADRQLKVGFDARGVEQLLQQANLPLWPAERPVTEVQLFLPSVAGGTRAVLASEHPPEREQLERAAELRGLPLAWPEQSVDLAQARTRAAVGSQALLLGVATGAGFGWTFSHADLRSKGEGGPATGVDLAADTLAARYAPASTKGLASLPVRVGGITDVAHYAELLAYLQTLSLVRSVSVEELSGSIVTLELGVRGDLELLRRIAALDGQLQPGGGTAPVAGAAPAPATDFTWQP